ncbi:hypothetical protein ACFY4C_23270 [Actinomadura viridis]|uniref:hypothetical protein n=1 Tax=Actinomadura viridis TaxID=58110 RepID=UPI003685F8AE
MGVDWIRMRPRPGVSRARLAALADAQAAAFAASGHWYEGEFDHLLTEPGPGSTELTGQVEMDRGPGNVRRVMLVTLNPALPAEWRLAAYRSHLPDELPGLLDGWRSHLDRVRDGAHRPYLRAWYRYATSRRLAQEWSELRARALAARDRTNAWATRPELVEVRERILAVPVPVVSPVPHWGADPPSPPDPPAPDPPGRGAAVALARAWNHRVPRGQRVYVTRPPGFGAYLDEALGSPDLADVLDWMDRARVEGYGLFLDW